MKGKVKLLSHVRLFVTPWTVAYQAPLSMGFSRQEYWSGLPFPSPEDLPDQGSNPGLPHCRQTLYHLSHQGPVVVLIYLLRGISWRSQWLGHHTSTTGGTSLIPGQGTKILQATWCDQTKKKYLLSVILQRCFYAFYSLLFLIIIVCDLSMILFLLLSFLKHEISFPAL